MTNRNIEPKKLDLEALLKKDRKFLLAMIDDPKSAYKKQQIRLDSNSTKKMDAAAERLRMQAIVAFSEIGKDGVNNCFNCRAFSHGGTTSPM